MKKKPFYSFWNVSLSARLAYVTYFERVKGLIPEVTNKEAEASFDYLVDMGEVRMKHNVQTA